MKIAIFAVWPAAGQEFIVYNSRMRPIGRAKMHPKIRKFALRVTHQNESDIREHCGRVRSSNPCYLEVRLEDENGALHPVNYGAEYYIKDNSNEKACDTGCERPDGTIAPLAFIKTDEQADALAEMHREEEPPSPKTAAGGHSPYDLILDVLRDTPGGKMSIKSMMMATNLEKETILAACKGRKTTKLLKNPERIALK